MLTIQKDDIKLTVTAGAFKGLYKSLGFKPVPEESTKLSSRGQGNTLSKANADLEDNSEPSDNDINEDIDDEDLSEIPFGEMNFKQLKKYAQQLGVDATGITDKRELRKLIRSALKN